MLLWKQCNSSETTLPLFHLFFTISFCVYVSFESENHNGNRNHKKMYRETENCEKWLISCMCRLYRLTVNQTVFVQWNIFSNKFMSVTNSSTSLMLCSTYAHTHVQLIKYQVSVSFPLYASFLFVTLVHVVVNLSVSQRAYARAWLHDESLLVELCAGTALHACGGNIRHQERWVCFGIFESTKIINLCGKKCFSQVSLQSCEKLSAPYDLGACRST